MAKIVICVFGVSGVGKSTLLASLTDESPSEIEHLQASRLIMDRRGTADREAIRKAETDVVIDNQRLLIDEFHLKSRQTAASVILFDGHCVVNNDVNLVPIPIWVVNALNPSHLVLVYDDPENISIRCLKDASRNRYQRTITEIDQEQRMSLDVCQNYRKKLDIPLEVITPNDVEILRKLVGIYQI